MNGAIEVSSLYKSFGNVRAVNDVNFTVERGDLFGFLGPNGAGKTTTQRMLTGILKPDKGRISIMGYNLLKNPFRAKMTMGIVPETANAYIDLTAWENLMLAADLYNVPSEKREEKGKELLEILGLIDRKNSKTRGFSKGMKQKLLLAISLIHEPDLLFLDEPTSGLDVKSSRQIRKLIKKLNKEGVTVFLTTHNLQEASSLCSTVAIIKKGKIIAIDSPENLRSTIESSQFVDVVFDRKITDISGIKKIESVNKIIQQDKNLKVYTSQPVKIAAELHELVRDKPVKITDIRTSRPSLEDVFVHLTEEKEEKNEG